MSIQLSFSNSIGSILILSNSIYFSVMMYNYNAKIVLFLGMI